MHYCVNPPIFRKNVIFCGEKGQDPEQNKDMETGFKTFRDTPKK